MIHRFLYILMCLLLFQPVWAQKYKKKYIDLLEPDSRLISSGFNFTIEKTNDKIFILKRYYPENRMMTHVVSSKSKSLEVRHGLYHHRYDDGTTVSKGYYLNNTKEGQWIENISEHGCYKNGKREGKWKSYNSDTIVVKVDNYLNDTLNGKSIEFDSLGNVKLEEEYKMGELISSSIDSSIKVVEVSPRFIGCENQSLAKKELNECAQLKLLEYIYSNIKYPARDRRIGVQGNALIKFVIEKDGSIGKITVVNGVSDGIKTEVINLIAKMPIWIPGMQNGKPVRVQFTLPVIFKLE